MLKRSAFPVLFSITTLGISSIITQISFSRELLAVFQSNELVLGISIASWLLLTGIGAALGRFYRGGRSILVLMFLSSVLLPFMHLLVLRALRFEIAPVGAALDLRTLFILVPLITTPYCLIGGVLLTAACSLLGSADDRGSIGRVYFFDNLGDIGGGLIFSLVLVHFTTAYNALYLPAVLNITAVVLLARYYRLKWPIPASLAVLVLVLWSFSHDWDSRSRKLLYPGQEIISQSESPYGRLTVTHDFGQYNFFENCEPYYSSGVSAGTEEKVHFPLCQLSGSDLRILLLSGGAGGMVGEVLKHEVSQVDYVELDPAVVSVWQSYIGVEKDPRLNIHYTDAGRYLRQSSESWDAVMMDLPLPSSLQVNRFYTLEFFQAVQAHLKPGGVFAFTLPSPGNYINEELSDLYRTVYSTGSVVFSHCRVFPASSAVFIFSDKELRQDAAVLVADKGIKTSYLTKDYLTAVLTEERTALLDQHLRQDGSINRDLRPQAFRSQLKYRFSIFDMDIGVLLMVIVCAAVLLLAWYRPVQSVIMSSGFAAAGLELVILLLFQIHSGYIYLRFGLIITLFMTGLAVGSYLSNRLLTAGLQTGLALLKRLDSAYLILVLCLGLLTVFSSLWRNEAVLYLMILLPAILTGAQFPAAALSLDGSAAAGRLYTADFLGAAAGSFLTALLLVPVMGAPVTVFIILLVKIFSFFRLVRAA